MKSRLTCFSLDPKLHPEYKKAEEWRDSCDPPPSGEEIAELCKAIHEYGQAAFDELLASYEKSREVSLSLLRNNAFLIAGVYTYFRAQGETIPTVARVSLTLWLAALVILAISVRRVWRPSRSDISQLQDAVVNGEHRHYANLNRATHCAIVEFRIVLNNEARILNYAIALTCSGLALLIIATWLA